MPLIRESERIAGVYIVELTVHHDTRGRFIETFRKGWFPQRKWNVVQMNRSESRAGVLRGLHYHHYQADYWHVLKGELRAGLVDIRPDSPTYRQTEVIAMGGENELGLFIPVGVAHGFAALTDVILTYVVDNYYDSTDEYGIAWNDPDLQLDWGVREPLVSARDAANPRLRELPADHMPRYRIRQNGHLSARGEPL